MQHLALGAGDARGAVAFVGVGREFRVRPFDPVIQKEVTIAGLATHQIAIAVSDRTSRLADDVPGGNLAPAES